MTLVLAALGLLAGVLTTLAGQGGGLFLIVACSLLVGPHEALAITAPALLLGNLHRAVLFRRFIDRGIAMRVVLGAIPGAFLGGLLAGAIPPWAIASLLVGLTLVAIARALKWLRWDVPRAALAPAGLVIGAMTGTAGGAGVLYSPVLLSSGLRGAALIGTLSTIGFSTHVGRVVAYAATGMFTPDLLVRTAMLAAAISAGNAVGERMRKRLTETLTTRLEYGVLVVCVAISLAGLA